MIAVLSVGIANMLVLLRVVILWDHRAVSRVFSVLLRWLTLETVDTQANDFCFHHEPGCSIGRHDLCACSYNT